MSTTIKQFQHLRIKLPAIQSATNNFGESNCIGRGGFGKVYKGELLQSNEKTKTTVAVKRLDRKFGHGDPEFWREIMTLSIYKHPNLVSLLGFCDERGEKILVYEYASNRSLDLYLGSIDLTWIQRLKICVGAARGLEYLHDPNGTQQRILHCDIKGSNVLLDENWNAKISDFGLSKISPANHKYSFLPSNPEGTFGYCDPSYMETAILTKESDVYSFGVVLFEVLCGRLCICSYHGERLSFVGLARQSFEQNKLNAIVFDRIKEEINPDSLKAFATIAYKCLKREREERPTMTQIVKELQIALEFQAPNKLGTGPAYAASPAGPWWYSLNVSLKEHVLLERPGEPECVYYMRGYCKFGSSCRYNHSPTLTLTNPLGPPLRLAPNMLGAGPAYATTHLSPTSPWYSLNKSQKEHVFPERPGEPECAYYMKTGDCKFGSWCRYDHPPALNLTNPLGLPLRPGAPVCSYYALFGVCNFGSSCKFDHPTGELSHASSTIADMPVAPYPIGS